MREIKKENNHYRLFDTYGEFIRACLGSSELKNSERSSRDNRDSWHGAPWIEAKRWGPVGDMQGAKSLRGAIIKEANRIMGQVSRFDPVYREEGGVWIDVSRYLSGEPEVWGDMVDQGATRKARRTAIVFNAGANCGVSASDYDRAARLMGGAILGLKAMGISVSLHLCYANRGGGETAITAINMTPGDGFDVARLAAGCKTWFFRRLVFSYWETLSLEFRSKHFIYKHGSYGRAEPMTQTDAAAVTGYKEATVLNMESLVRMSDEAIKKAILGTIKQGEA